ncbi:DUF6352 family protein [Oricola cellulosilytica]|uniref:Uncharacterized protein n=1 Tax=Oricola cellulosilytica TaxID=1429082 RepID=A0A4R0P4X4_9HYPH|nr:DUF6352 family protein [Oricola cellulosilytica]TCD11912.1 hypothetical protein E0D97_16405 [Oricola cellulosilytica]
MPEMLTEEKPKSLVWKSSGLHLTHRLANGWLAVTPDIMRAYYTRPEIHPIEESCPAEHALFEKLMDDPMAAVDESEILAIADADAADNYRLVLNYRDHLVSHGSVEAGYRAFFVAGAPTVPPLFLEQLAHMIVSNILDGETDPFTVRAAELFFREQKATTTDGQLMLADAEVVEMYSRDGGMGGLGALLAEAGTPLREVSLDVMTEENAPQYWARADQFNFAIDFRFTERAPDALAGVIGRWIGHFYGTPVRVQAMQSVRDERWSWHVGLDATASAILNALYEGKTLDEAMQERMVALFRVEFLDPSRLVESMRGKPVYLGLAMNDDNLIRLKPQNLLVNLPVETIRQ